MHPDYDMIKDTDPQHIARRGQAPSQSLIFWARGRISGRMVVREYDGVRRVADGRFENLARMDERGGQGPTRDLDDPKHAVFHVE